MNCKHKRTEGRQGRIYCLDCGADLEPAAAGCSWETATFQLDPDDDLEPLSDGARGLEAHAKALKGVGTAVSDAIATREGNSR